MNIIRWVVIAVFCFLFSSASAKETITIWHSFSGSIAHHFQKIASRFNDDQSKYYVNLVYKGNYIESLASFAAAYHAGHPPDMIQVFEVGRSVMISVQENLLPVTELITPEIEARILPAVKRFYSNDRMLMAFPLNVSIPVMYYDMEALAKVAPNEPFPQTWQEFESLLVKLKRNGYECAYTTAFPAWIHFESFTSLHGISFISADNPKAVRYRQSAVINHWSRLKKWQKKRLFRYGGRDSDATNLFTSHTCVIFSQSSGSWYNLRKMVKFPVGIASLPVDSDISPLRHANTFGGAALWVVRTNSKQKRAGMKAWLNYFAQPDTQWYWYKKTGYLPMVDMVQLESGSKLLKIASKDLIRAKSTGPIFWGPQNQLRTILDEALEELFSETRTVNSTLDFAEKQANYRLLRFEKNYKTN